MHCKNDVWIYTYSERLYGAIADRARLSDYFYTLHQASKKRYTQKITIFNGEDPYWLKKDAFHSWRTIFPILSKQVRVAIYTALDFKRIYS